MVGRSRASLPRTTGRACERAIVLEAPRHVAAWVRDNEPRPTQRGMWSDARITGMRPRTPTGKRGVFVRNPADAPGLANLWPRPIEPLLIHLTRKRRGCRCRRIRTVQFT